MHPLLQTRSCNRRRGHPRTRVLTVPWVLLLVSALACQGEPPARLVVDTAALVVNAQGPVSLADAVTAMNTEGKPIDDATIEWAVDSGSAAVQQDDRLRCTTNGDVRVRFTAGAVQATGTVRCRPVSHFSISDAIVLLTGSAPQPVAVPALDPDGRPVTEMRASIRIKDTTVARMRGQLVEPVARGSTVADITVGEQTTFAYVTVVDPVLNERVDLAPSEFRSWPLQAGHFRISMVPTNVADRALPEFRSNRANCAPSGREVGTWNCVVDSSGTFVMQGKAGKPPVSVQLAVVRMPDTRR
ncbi:MAG: hypothetical protein V4617_02665 [Gemmatimonadota bacterium]